MELNSLKVKSGHKVMFASGQIKSDTGTTTLQAPSGMKVVLYRLLTDGSNTSRYSVTVDSIKVVDGIFLGANGFNIAAIGYAPDIPPLIGNRIVINRESGYDEHRYNYLYIKEV